MRSVATAHTEMKPLELLPKTDEHDKLIDGAKEPQSPSRHSTTVTAQSERRRCAVTALYCAVYLLIGPTLIVVNRLILKELHFNLHQRTYAKTTPFLDGLA